MEHVVDLRIDGLSDLSDKLQENFDKFVQELNTSMDAAAQLVVDSQNNLSKCLESVDNTLRLWVSSINENVSLKQGLGIDVKSSTDKQVDTNSKKKDKGYVNESHGVKENKPNDPEAAKAASNYHVMDNGEILLLPDEEEDAELYEVYGPYWDAQKKKNYYEEYDFKKKKYVRNYNAKYAKGTTRAKGGMSLVNDGPGNKPEIIVTKQGILMPLAPGDGVIPGDLTENLMKIAKNGGLPMQMPEIKMPDINTNQVVNSNTNINFDSLIRIDGNVDEKVIPSIEEIAKGLIGNKNFKQNVYNFTSKELAKDMRKAGY